MGMLDLLLCRYLYLCVVPGIAHSYSSIHDRVYTVWHPLSCLFACLFSCLLTCLLACLFSCLFVRLFVGLFACLLACLLAGLFVFFACLLAASVCGVDGNDIHVVFLVCGFASLASQSVFC